MSKSPFMQFYGSDFVGDTMELDAAEVGAYVLLLIAQWNRKGKSLPDDPKKLQRITRTGRNWPKIWASIQHFFDKDEDGIFQPRCRLDAQNVARKSEVNAHNGARGGRAKALKNNKPGLANATNSPERKATILEPEPYRIDGSNEPSLFPDVSEPEPDDVQICVDAYNEAADQAGWPKVQSVTTKRKAALRARLKECGGPEGWNAALDKAKNSPHLCGQNSRGWRASFDFLTQQSSFTKLMEGNYDDRSRQTSFGAPGTSPNGSGQSRPGSGTADAFGLVAQQLSGGKRRDD